MPIQITPTTSLNLFGVKKNFEKISKEGFKLMNPSAGGSLYLSAMPGVDDLDEGSAVFVNDSGTFKLAFKINNSIKSVTLV